MERVNAICRHKLWRESVDEIARLEQGRAFCRHDRAHFLDVARLAYIENLERGLGVDKELIYAAALLHDIGRHLQYTQNIPHDEAGAQLAEIIMADCGFSPAERAEVTQAILQHRGDGDRSRDGLAALLCRLRDAGLWGMEAIYGANSPETTYRHLKMAGRFGLYTTAGSDFHGGNSPGIELGMPVSDDILPWARLGIR